MKGITQRIARFGLGLGLAATMALSAAVPALADDVTGTVNVTAGNLTMNTASDAPTLAVTLTGLDQQVSDNWNIPVVDARGSGAGWSIQMSAGAFTGMQGGTERTLAAAPAITGVNIATVDGTAPTNGTSYGSGIAISSAQKVVSVAADSGMGSFTVAPTLRINVPAETYAATTYTGTITVTIGMAP
jgi:hypothetical protein